MIILAAAIILSLSNSGIIGKANKAKTDSDTANLKEYVNTLRAEWELMTDAERTAKANSFEAYANEKLAANGYKVMLSDDGVLMNEVATAAVKAGIKVGDIVTGYTVTETTYTTSGEENTADPADYIEINPQPQTVKTNTNVTWKYLGVNAKGELEIMADLGEEAADNTMVTLGGKGGYLKGPAMLNTICEKLYSKEGVGTARSMNIDDVNNILGYTGPKGTYYDTDNKIIETTTPLTIGEIENKLGTTLRRRKTPDGKDIAAYYSDAYGINEASENIKNTANQDLVYNAFDVYWLASPCVLAYFGYGYAAFCVLGVSSAVVDEYSEFTSDDFSGCDKFAVRPVVTLNSNVKLTPNADKTEWAIS